MRNRVLQTIKKYNMLQNTDSVTVALSGGADSMALLHILNELKTELNIKVFAAHLNHCLRGADADSDEAAVVLFCKSINVPLVHEKINVKAAAENSGDSIETVARNIRYEFLNRTAHGVIATAHTASDNLETVIFNTVRGSGLKGVCGIPAKRDNIIRPLIECTREDVETYCKQNGLEFCTDKTNFDETYSRNNIRKNVVPRLKQINNNAERNVTRLTEIVTADEEFLSGFAVDSLNTVKCNGGINSNSLKAFHKAIAFRVIKMFCEQQTGEVPEYLHITKIWEAVENGKGFVNLKSNYKASVSNSLLKITKITKVCTGPEDYFEFPKNFTQIKYKNYIFKLIKFEKIVNFKELPFKNAIDCDTILDTLVIRNRKSGDKFTLGKRKVTKTLKKWFCELKPQNRNSLLVLADTQNVVWVESLGVNFKNQVTNKTKNVLIIEKQGETNGGKCL